MREAFDRWLQHTERCGRFVTATDDSGAGVFRGTLYGSEVYCRFADGGFATEDMLWEAWQAAIDAAITKERET